MKYREFPIRCEAFKVNGGYIGGVMVMGKTLFSPDRSAEPDSPLHETAELALKAAEATAMRFIDRALERKLPGLEESAER